MTAVDYADYDTFSAMAAAVRRHSQLVPRVALLLGTGLGGVASAIDEELRLPYQALPGMPQSTADHHAGELILGHLEGEAVLAFSGRLHCYEGYSPSAVVAPVRLSKVLGARTLIMGSAVGGLHPHYELSQIVLIEDHINLMGVCPLVGANDERFGPRWPDMIEPYDHGLIALAQKRALQRGWSASKATYVGVLGPNLETRAEYRMLRGCGGDVVGMSTVPETIAAVHCGMTVLACGIVTDRCLPDALEPVDIEKIISAATAAEAPLSQLIRDVVADLHRGGV